MLACSAAYPKSLCSDFSFCYKSIHRTSWEGCTEICRGSQFHWTKSFWRHPWWMVWTVDVYQPAMILTQVRRPDFTPKLTNYFHKNFFAFAQHLISYLFSRDFRGFPLHRANVYYKLSNKRNNYSIDLLLTRLSTSHIKAVNALQSFVRKQPLTSHEISQRASIFVQSLRCSSPSSCQDVCRK